jgi:hypothetical protein
MTISFRVSGVKIFNTKVSRNGAPLKGELISLRIGEGRAVGCEANCIAGQYVLQLLIALVESTD